MVYDLICEGVCNPNIAIIDKLAQEYMSDRYAVHGRQRANDMVKMQRMLKYTPHIKDDDHRYAICGVCMTRRKFGA